MRPTIIERMEQGIPHDPRSVAVYSHVARVDYEQCDDTLSLKAGGDGDNGEHLMYLLDDYFAEADAHGTVREGYPPSVRLDMSKVF